jgi:class 3 adenylate cyclase
MPLHSAPMHQVERQLVAILAADIAGYSRLIEADEERTLAQLRTCRRGAGRALHCHASRQRRQNYRRRYVG